MRKTTLILSGLMLLGLISCKKDRVCECTSTSTLPGSTTETEQYTLIDIKKSTAKKICVSRSQTYDIGGTTYTSKDECKLK